MSEARHVLEDYRLDRVLSSTARTTVFRAVDPSTDRPVVIKLIHPPGPTIDESNRSAFLYAAEVARTGAIGGLPRIVDFGLTHDDNAFLVMSMVDLAVPVEELADAAPTRLRRIALGVTNAVDTLAMSGAAHLNLSPANVLVTPDDRVLLAGYGTGAFLAGAPSGVWPDDGDPWAAPELAGPDALSRVDVTRADLYSLAKVVVHILGAEVSDHVDGSPTVRPIVGTAGNVGELETALAAAMSPEPADRGVAVSDLARLLAEGIADAPGDAAAGGLDPSAYETRAITAPLFADETAADEVMNPVQEEADEEEPLQAAAEDRSTREMEAPSPPPAGDPAPTDGGQADRSFRWDIVAPLAAVAVVVLLVAVLVAGGSSRTELELVETPVPVNTMVEVPTPAEEPEPAVNPLLEQAEQLLLTGDVEGSRRLLEDLPGELVAGFGAEERELYDGLLGSIEGEDRDKALADLVGGLGYGSVRMLRRGIAGLSDLTAEERAAIPDLESNLARARRGVRLHNELAAAERAGDHLRVMDLSAEMMQVLPDYSRSYTFREQAAEALDAASRDAIERRDLDAAVRILADLEERWPGRDGVADRIAWCQAQLRADRELESVLQRARAAGERGEPEAGIRVLDEASPTGTYIARFGSLRGQLEDQLAQMDEGVPTIELDPAFDASFKKNETVTVPLTVTDDFRVERVAAFVARHDGTEYRELVLEPAADGSCPVVITPELHGNKSVYFYVVAADPAGHQVYLGSPDAPYEIKRQKWFQKVLP